MALIASIALRANTPESFNSTMKSTMDGCSQLAACAKATGISAVEIRQPVLPPPSKRPTASCWTGRSVAQ
ncbi:hypothetical protein M3Y99_00104300 [Aphelenchoides fujianensis]|nr:hypothetical protein M3Y99_00104300 [Aphelenchoides fujianensis]